MANKIQHNRKIDYSAKYAADAEYERLRNMPTNKIFQKTMCDLS